MKNKLISLVVLLFGPKTDEVIGGWRKLHNEELHNLYSSPNITMIKSRMIGELVAITCGR
jgi:hypothetical protein